MQDSIHIRLGNMKRGHDADHDACQQSDGEGIEEDAPIEAERKAEGKIGVQVEMTKRTVAPMPNTTPIAPPISARVTLSVII